MKAKRIRKVEVDLFSMIRTILTTLTVSLALACLSFNVHAQIANQLSDEPTLEKDILRIWSPHLNLLEHSALMDVLSNSDTEEVNSATYVLAKCTHENFDLQGLSRIVTFGSFLVLVNDSDESSVLCPRQSK